MQIFVISIWKTWPVLLFVFDQYESLPVTLSGHDEDRANEGLCDTKIPQRGFLIDTLKKIIVKTLKNYR